MCKGHLKKSTSVAPSRKLLLTSLESFGEDSKGQIPSNTSLLFSICTFSLFLLMCEHTIRQLLLSYSHLHPIMEDEMSRLIFARHIGVDLIGCAAVSIFGFRSRYVMQELFDAVIYRKNSMPKAYDNRMYKYHPEAARVIVLFLGYQFKNMYDTIIFNDGALFIAHHILALGTAWGALFPGAAHFYGIFYLGLSEGSTAALCFLANFDDEFGVKGLGDAFPMTKVISGAIFAVLFILFRVIMWSVISYYYVSDVRNVLKNKDDPRLVGRKIWFQFTGISLSLLSLLQIIWLGEIFMTGKREMEKMGFL
jgi:hypothetical protein